MKNNRRIKDRFNEVLQAADQNRVPAMAIFELTARCNFDCPMCFVHEMKMNKTCYEELSTEQWKAIFDQAIDAGLLVATLTGGECLLRPDFKELYLYLYDKGISVSVNTNSYLLNEDYISFFTAHSPYRLQISLYGTNDEEYLTATGLNGFSRVSENLKLLAKTNLPVRLAITPSAEAKPFLDHIIRFAEENGYNYEISQMLLPPREELDREKTSVSAEDICGYLQYRAMLRGRKLIPKPIETLPEPGTGGETLNIASHCTAGRNRTHIDWRGVMHPCVSMPDISCSVLENDYLTAWKYMCKAIDGLSFPAKCSSCAYQKICSPCYASRCGDRADSCNPETCKLMQLKVACGLRKL